ncbi:MAG: hypothetical protein EOP33_07250 [Rickettsiaceae bacterium]|nr:MAG: hypothetical protein EOP33_07250 [Rickettsiaceae bacterium]
MSFSSIYGGNDGAEGTMGAFCIAKCSNCGKATMHFGKAILRGFVFCLAKNKATQSLKTRMLSSEDYGYHHNSVKNYKKYNKNL